MHTLNCITKMAITLQIVGLFFKADLNLTTDTNVYDVLVKAHSAADAGDILNVSQFNFTLGPTGGVSSFLVKYQKPFNGRELNPPRSYPAGEYYLVENLASSPAYTVWQYYLVDADGKNINQGIKFPKDPQAIVPVNGKLIWRLVTILNGPSVAPAPVQNALLSSKT
jgi:hypothetical protein